MAGLLVISVLIAICYFAGVENQRLFAGMVALGIALMAIALIIALKDIKGPENAIAETYRRIENLVSQQKTRASDTNYGDAESSEEALFLDIERINSICDKIEANQLSDKNMAGLLKFFCEVFNLVQGVAFVKEDELFHQKGVFNVIDSENIEPFSFGDGLHGQVAKDGKYIHVDNLKPEHIMAFDGEDIINPTTLLIFPVVSGNEVNAVVEVSSLNQITRVEAETMSAVIFKLFGTILNTTRN